jgi:hypothetical protein
LAVRLTLGLVATIVVGLAVVALLEWNLVRARQSPEELAAQLAGDLPIGSSETTINSYLDRSGYSHEIIIVDQRTDTIDADPGTRVIRADSRVSRTLFRSAKERTIFFVLSSDNELERTIVRERDVV